MRPAELLKYTPAIVSANRVHDVPLGPKHAMLLFDNIKAAGKVQYAFLLAVLDNATEEPVYFVSSEVNAMAAVFHDGSHYLCTFSEAGHGNLGGSDDWGDPRKFFPEAIRLAAEHIGVCLDEVYSQKNDSSALPPDLIDAAGRGDLSHARELLNKGAEVNEKRHDGVSALMLASGRGHSEIVKLLLARGAGVNSGTGHTALMLAANQGYTEIVKMLLNAGAEVNARDEDGQTALLATALTGHAGIIKLLLNAGADVNAITQGGHTALIWASLKGHTETVKTLLNAGAEVNAKTVNGSTALMLASEQGHTEIVQLLKQAGARDA